MPGATMPGQLGAGGAVRGAEHSPRRRGGTRGALCLDLRAGRGAEDPLPRDPALAHLARRRTEAPGQQRSAWRSRGAEELEVWGWARQEPWRGLAGRATWERVVAALARIGGGGLSFPVCICLSVHPPASLHWALGLQAFIYPDPGNDVIGTAPNPFSHPSGGRPQLAPPSASGLSLLVSAAHLPWVWLQGGYLASRR